MPKRENYSNQGVTKQFTSARLNSKFAFTYGKVEIKAKLPTGVGTWPAIWMLGKNIIEDGAYWQTKGFGTTSWPACGEIDIMEHWGDKQNFVQSAMHTPSSNGATQNHGGQTIATASTSFHVYSLEWSPKKMVFSVDGNVHYTYNPEVKNSSTWPFNAPQYLLLNIAIQPSIASSFTQSPMVLDYVRVYQESPLSVENPSKRNEVFVYPNPTSDIFLVKLADANQIQKVTVFDRAGKTVLTSANAEVSLSKVAKGVYFLKITDINGTTYFSKIFKK